MAVRNITMIAGTGGQIQAFKNGVDLGYFRGTKTVSANDGDNISVWCDADTGYVYTKLCTPDGTCTTLRPFNFVVNMDISMTATFTSTTIPCTQQDNSLLINNRSGVITVAPGDVLIASVRATGAVRDVCLGLNTPKWAIIAKAGSPAGPSDTAITNRDNTFGSSGCGSTAFSLNVEGTYSLICRWCCDWSIYDPYTCSVYNTDLPNTVVVKVSSVTPPPIGGGCDPSTCLPTKNFCIAGNCVPKSYAFLGAAALVGYMLLSKS